MQLRGRSNRVFAVLLTAVAVQGALFAWLTTRVWRERGPIALDARIDGWFSWLPVGAGRAIPASVLERIVVLGSPPAVGVAAIALVAWTLRRGDERLIKLAVLGPLLGAGGAALVAKPLIGRQLEDTFGFPSGHTAGVASVAFTTAVVLAVARRPGDGQGRPGDQGGRPDAAVEPADVAAARRRSLVLRGLVAAMALATAPVMAVTVVRGGWHVATDAVGALLFSGAVVAAVAAVCLRLVPAERPVIARVAYRRLSLVATGGALGLFGAVRLPFLELSPGSLIALNEAMVVDDDVTAASGPLHGTYSGLTVRSTPLTFGRWAWHELTGSPNPVVPRELLIPKGEDGDTFRAEQRAVFADASQVAVAVAEQALGEDVAITGDGALVTGLLPDGPAAAALRPGDVITAIDDRAVTTETDLREALAAATDGVTPAADATVTVTVTVRDLEGAVRREQIDLRVLEATGRFGLGIGVTTSNLRFELSTEVEVDGGDVGGPSAGLLTALAVYDALSPEDVAAGRHVTGTGTLAIDGQVGEIGGIEEKVRAAIGAGADVFFAPASQADDARAVARGRIDIIAVETFDEALTALRTA